MRAINRVLERKLIKRFGKDFLQLMSNYMTQPIAAKIIRYTAKRKFIDTDRVFNYESILEFLLLYADNKSIKKLTIQLNHSKRISKYY